MSEIMMGMEEALRTGDYGVVLLAFQHVAEISGERFPAVVAAQSDTEWFRCIQSRTHAPACSLANALIAVLLLAESVTPSRAELGYFLSVCQYSTVASILLDLWDTNIPAWDKLLSQPIPDPSALLSEVLRKRPDATEFRSFAAAWGCPVEPEPLDPSPYEAVLLSSWVAESPATPAELLELHEALCGALRMKSPMAQVFLMRDVDSIFLVDFLDLMQEPEPSFG
jgi:hypothetical protein